MRPRHWRVTYRGGPLDGLVHESLAAMRPHRIGVVVRCWYELDGDEATFVSAKEMDLSAHGQAAYAAGVRAAAEKCRAECLPCGGDGIGGRDEWHREYECEYCGRPRAAILALLEGGDDAEV